MYMYIVPGSERDKVHRLLFCLLSRLGQLELVTGNDHLAEGQRYQCGGHCLAILQI